MRRSKQDELREKRNQAKLSEMTKIYFQNEQNLMKHKQKSSSSSSIFYADDFSKLYDIPDDRLTFRN